MICTSGARRSGSKSSAACRQSGEGMTDAHPSFEIPQALATDLETKLGMLLNVGSEAAELGKRIVGIHLVGKSRDSDYSAISYLIFAKGFKTFQTIQ